jgi:putative phosphoesterase
MKYLILSDSHGFHDTVSKLKKELKHVDAIIHLGDHCEDVRILAENSNLPVYAIIGNCDSKSFGKTEILIKDQGKSVLMTHGHHYNVKHSLMNLFYKGQEIGADIILFGHTHIPLTEIVEGIWIHNPGSLCLPKVGTTKGFSILEISESEVRIDRHELLE